MEAKVGKLARWASKLAEYQLEITYQKGTEMQHVDFLSRNIEEDNSTELPDRCFAAIQMDETKGFPT